MERLNLWSKSYGSALPKSAVSTTGATNTGSLSNGMTAAIGLLYIERRSPLTYLIFGSFIRNKTSNPLFSISTLILESIFLGSSFSVITLFPIWGLSASGMGTSTARRPISYRDSSGAIHNPEQQRSVTGTPHCCSRDPSFRRILRCRQGGPLQSDPIPSNAQVISRTGAPMASMRGVTPRPGSADAFIRPFVRQGAPSAVETVT